MKSGVPGQERGVWGSRGGDRGLEFSKWNEVIQLFSCIWLCDPMDCSLPGSSVYGIFQARILEWVAISFSRKSSQPRDWTLVSRIVGRHFAIWATREVQGGEKDKLFFSTFLSLPHIKLFFFKPGANDYTTKQLSLNSKDYITTMHPAWGHVSPSWEPSD